jgi:hypothetical protein
MAAARMRKRQEDRGFASAGGTGFSWWQAIVDELLTGCWWWPDPAVFCCGRGIFALFRLNLLKTGYFRKHYMLHVLSLMCSICCDRLPSTMRVVTRIFGHGCFAPKGCFSKVLRAGPGASGEV